MGARDTHGIGINMTSSNIPTRSPYQGLTQIFQYNRPFYMRTISGVIAATILSLWLPVTIRTPLLLATGAAALWTCSSLLVSHYVYDRSNFYSLCWLPGCLSRPPARWINIHAGVDESSSTIASMFPGSEGQITDIYDSHEMTEPSIERARRIAAAPLATTDWRALPAPDQKFDAAFLIFAAHELRQHAARVQLFREVGRVLRVGGELVLVEHSRDWANFLAFGPGFLHFFSERIWQNAAIAAGLPIQVRRTLTPFVHVFVLRRQG
jgi:SAM-dependent methyltransferase